MSRPLILLAVLLLGASGTAAPVSAGTITHRAYGYYTPAKEAQSTQAAADVGTTTPADIARARNSAIVARPIAVAVRRSSATSISRRRAARDGVESFPRLRRLLADERGGTAEDDGPNLIYEHNPKHGPVARQGPNGEISRAPRGDCQAMLECSTQLGPKLRSGVEPETGLEVLFRRHRVFGDTEWWHGYVPGG